MSLNPKRTSVVWQRNRLEMAKEQINRMIASLKDEQNDVLVQSLRNFIIQKTFKPEALAYFMRKMDEVNFKYLGDKEKEMLNAFLDELKKLISSYTLLIEESQTDIQTIDDPKAKAKIQAQVAEYSSLINQYNLLIKLLKNKQQADIKNTAAYFKIHKDVIKFKKKVMDNKVKHTVILNDVRKIQKVLTDQLRDKPGQSPDMNQVILSFAAKSYHIKKGEHFLKIMGISGSNFDKHSPLLEFAKKHGFTEHFDAFKTSNILTLENACNDLIKSVSKDGIDTNIESLIAQIEQLKNNHTTSDESKIHWIADFQRAQHLIKKLNSKIAKEEVKVQSQPQATEVAERRKPNTGFYQEVHGKRAAEKSRKTSKTEESPPRKKSKPQ